MHLPKWACNVLPMTTAQLIHQAREAAGVSVAALAEQSLIPRTTLQRKLAGEADFTTTEVHKIARVLKVRTSSLIAEVVAERSAAA